MKTSRQVVKSNLFVRFFEETSACKNHFTFVWPLCTVVVMNNVSFCFCDLLKFSAYFIFWCFSNPSVQSKSNLRTREPPGNFQQCCQAIKRPPNNYTPVIHRHELEGSESPSRRFTHSTELILFFEKNQIDWHIVHHPQPTILLTHLIYLSCHHHSLALYTGYVLSTQYCSPQYI